MSGDYSSQILVVIFVMWHSDIVWSIVQWHIVVMVAAFFVCYYNLVFPLFVGTVFNNCDLRDRQCLLTSGKQKKTNRLYNT